MYAYKAYLPSLTINKDNVNRLNKIIIQTALKFKKIIVIIMITKNKAFFYIQQ